MHQGVVSAFPAKRLIIKTVGPVIPQRLGTWVNRKKGNAQAGRRRRKARKRHERARRRGENWKNDILREWQTQGKPLGLHGIGGGKSLDRDSRSNTEMIENGEDVRGDVRWATELATMALQGLSLFRYYQATESVGTDT